MYLHNLPYYTCFILSRLKDFINSNKYNPLRKRNGSPNLIWVQLRFRNLYYLIVILLFRQNEVLKTALKEATGSETGKDGIKYALVCYSGKSYAQKATDLMIEMGIPKENIYTLDGGMKDWEAGGDEYKALLK